MWLKSRTEIPAHLARRPRTAPLEALNPIDGRGLHSLQSGQQPPAGSSLPKPPHRSPGCASLANKHWPSLLASAAASRLNQDNADLGILSRFKLDAACSSGEQSMTTTREQPVVFIIDDDASVRRGLEDLLRSVDLEVELFGSAQEFLARERPDAPGCIVLDVRLPGASGLEFQRVLAELNIHLPVIFISGHGDIPMSVRAIKSGAIEFLTKPLKEQELLDAVHASGARANLSPNCGNASIH